MGQLFQIVTILRADKFGRFHPILTPVKISCKNKTAANTNVKFTVGKMNIILTKLAYIRTLHRM